MSFDVKTIAMAGVFSVGSLIYVALKPDAYEEHRALIIQQFDLPEDVEFISLKSGYNGSANVKGRNEYAAAEIQLTPEQYKTFTNTGTPSTFVPFEIDRKLIDTPPREGWNTWWEFDYAYITNLTESPYAEKTRKAERALRDAPFVAIRWGPWKNPEGVYKAKDNKQWKSFCWAYSRDFEGAASLRACTDFPPTNFRPSHQVRAVLDETTRRLYVSID